MTHRAPMTQSLNCAPGSDAGVDADEHGAGRRAAHARRERDASREPPRRCPAMAHLGALGRASPSSCAAM